ncbi:MAG: DNA polymerase/3'-5' exonuclease PolX [Chlamydiae bacterium]|nr:DNA polymerase/3'-5' exonuclease PolX [Chlamydiota bacterium]MBI3276642.1 DNA polymerase/3'-5' exonuclease PolX [Chlamydiota bacterium]
MDKQKVSEILKEIGVLLELKGENPFKARAYANAARVIEGWEGDLTSLVQEGKLSELKGIGEALSQKITELVRTGHLSYYEELKKSIPSGLFEMLMIPGLGPKRIQTIYQKLKLTDMNQLEKACHDHQLRELEGFGEKTEERILQGIEFVRKNESRHRFDVAYAQAQIIFNALKEDKRIIRSSIAGSLRRHKEIIKDIDILVSAHEKDADGLMDSFTSFSQVNQIVAKGITKSSVLLKSGINVDLRVVKDAEFPYALHHFTGSREHNTSVRSRAKKMGLKLNEYGLFREDEALIQCKNEEEIFEALKLTYIPPELRENQGEIEASEQGRIPKLISAKDIKGVFHVHSVWSDGNASLRDMIQACVNLGYEYVGISDHSQAAFYAKGLKEDQVKKQQEELDELGEEFKEIQIFKGIEADILADGSVDYDETIWPRFDFIIASVHSRFGMSQKEMTQRIIKAMENPYVTFLGHPTGRLILEREPYAVNLHEVIDAAHDLGVAMELNASPYRFDLDWRLCPYAKSKGVKMSIHPDAHSVEGLNVISLGVGIARKGWLEAKDVVNTMAVKKIEQFLKKRRNN